MNLLKPFPHIILASQSPRRKELLAVLGIQPTIIVSHADESKDVPSSPGQYVEEVALRKANAVLTQWQQASQSQQTTHIGREHIILSADTAVVLDDQILGKPRDHDDARQTLAKLQNREHEVYSSVCLFNISSGEIETRHSVTRVHMRHLSDSELSAYVATGEPMDKAGSYAIQGLGSTFVTHIEGDYFTVVGLPLQLLDEMLRNWGYSLLSQNA